MVSVIHPSKRMETPQRKTLKEPSLTELPEKKHKVNNLIHISKADIEIKSVHPDDRADDCGYSARYARGS